MTTNDNELLSALVDGQLQGQELDEAITLLNTKASAREQLQRYQQSSDVLRGYGTRHQSIDLTQKISDALADEPRHSPTIEAPAEKAAVLSLPSRFWQQTLGLAVAASFGALAVVGITKQPDSQLVPMVPMAVLETAPEVTVAKAAEVPIKEMAKATTPEVPKSVMVAETKPTTLRNGNRWTVEEQEIEDRLNVYLIDHNEYAGASDIFSNARVIAYESGQ